MTHKWPEAGKLWQVSGSLSPVSLYAAMYGGRCLNELFSRLVKW